MFLQGFSCQISWPNCFRLSFSSSELSLLKSNELWLNRDPIHHGLYEIVFWRWIAKGSYLEACTVGFKSVVHWQKCQTRFKSPLFHEDHWVPSGQSLSVKSTSERCYKGKTQGQPFTLPWTPWREGGIKIDGSLLCFIKPEYPHYWLLLAFFFMFTFVPLLP